MSGQAAQYFLTQILRMKGDAAGHPARSVFPNLNLLGVLPSIVRSQRRTYEEEERALDRLKAYGEKEWKRGVLLESSVPRLADISKASGSSVPYLRHSSVRQIFDKLGQEIDRKLR